MKNNPDSSLHYQAARETALRVYPHFVQHFGERGVNLLPDVDTIGAIVDAAFWASLRREEIYTPKISLAFVGPEQVDMPMAFERPVRLAPAPLTRLSPAVERPGIHLGVWRQNGDLWVWGATRNLPEFCFVLEVIGPGLVVIKHSRGDESGKYVNVAVLNGEEIKIIDQRAATEPDCPSLLTSLLGLNSHFSPPDSVNALIQLAVSMRAHGRGGSLLVVPVESQAWRESVLTPITYSLQPSFLALSDLMKRDPAERNRRRWQESLRRVIDTIAGLTAVDGATVITDRYELLAFGVKIVRREGYGQVAQLIVTEPIEGSAASIAEPAQLGGTRHLSAAQFTHDQRDTIALVASQDGRFTVLGWSPCEKMVHAHRIETLLL
jgi:hypothetical protein